MSVVLTFRGTSASSSSTKEKQTTETPTTARPSTTATTMSTATPTPTATTTTTATPRPIATASTKTPEVASKGKPPPTAIVPRNFLEEQAQLKLAMEQSLQDPTSEEMAIEMAINAIDHLQGIGINVSLSPLHAQRTGNCLFESIVLIRNPDASEADRRELTSNMRHFSVLEAIRQVDLMDEERLGRLLDIITPLGEERPTKEDLKQRLLSYLKDGEFEEDAGDLLPFLLAFHLHCPIIIVDLGTPTPNVYPVFPDAIFETRPGPIGSPLFLARRGFHFECLLSSLNGDEANVMALYNEDQAQQVTQAQPALPPAPQEPRAAPVRPQTPQAEADESLAALVAPPEAPEATTASSASQVGSTAAPTTKEAPAATEASEPAASSEALAAAKKATGEKVVGTGMETLYEALQDMVLQDDSFEDAEEEAEEATKEAERKRAEEGEEARRATEAAELMRKAEKAAEEARMEVERKAAEEAEKARRAAEAAENMRREEEAAEEAKKEAERKAVEEAEEARSAAEAAEVLRRAEETAEEATKEAERRRAEEGEDSPIEDPPGLPCFAIGCNSPAPYRCLPCNK